MDDSAVRLSVPKAGGAAGLALLALAMVFMAVDAGLYPFALFGVIGLGVAGFGGFHAWEGLCPDCGYKNSWLTKRPSAFQCKGCDNYLDGADGTLKLQSDDALAEFPVYEADLPDRIRWPDGCCVCGAPATRTLQAELEERERAGGKDLAARIATAGTVGIDEVRKYKVEVPHCDAHSGGAALHRGRDDQGAGLRIAFRSRTYQRAFSALNPDA